VVSTDHHTVKPWFAGRIALSPPVDDFAAEGFKLVGGRLDKAAGAPAAVVVYRHGGHEIDLFVWADRGAALPAAAVARGYRSMFWKRKDLDFAAVSDTSEPELAKFVQLVQAEPE
jgi:anti-sigma factor RsiW